MKTERPGLIWLRPERSARGPAPAHSRAEIAAAAIALADAEGLAAVSMRRIAAALGSGTMSLYTYVPKKEHLFDLMLDAVAGEWDLPEAPSGDPRADLLGFGREGLAAMRRHPWVPALVLTRLTLGPNSLRCTEYFLAVLEAVDLPGGAKLELFAMLNGSICQFAQWEANQGAAGPGDEWQAELAAYLGEAVSSGAYPYLAAAVADGRGAQPAGPDEVFERGFSRIVDAVLGALG